jgi:mannose-1-phosphate guanylyltransferase/phosphomannomutase
MVLAAGAGERMRPLTDHLPKPLLPIALRPVMSYILEHLGRHGFTNVVANVHHRAQQIMDCLGDGSRYGVHLTYSYEEKLWGSAGSVKRNQDFFGREPFLVIGADDLTGMDLGALVENHRRARAIASIGLVEVQETSQFGIVVTDESGRIQRFVEKPKDPAPSRTANTQIYLFEPEILDLIPGGEWYDFGFNVFPELVAGGRPFYGFTLPGYWRDIGSAADYLAAQEDVMQGRVRSSIQGAQPKPGIWVGEGCEIHPEAKLVPPVVIGSGCRVGAGAVVGGTTAIGEDVVVPSGTSLCNCVVWQGVHVPVGEWRRAVICRESVVVQVK